MSINISDQAAPVLNHIEATLAERAGINQEIGRSVVTLCKTYLADYAPSRHASAQKLGANPTGFVGAAIDAIHFSADAAVIVVDFQHPWFAAVGHDVHIEPGPGKKFLAIPIAKDSYGVRLQGQTGGRFFKGPRGGLFWGRPYPGNEKVMQPLYVLVSSLDQKQDRSRLPSDQEILDCVRSALRDQIEQRIRAINSVTP